MGSSRQQQVTVLFVLAVVLLAGAGVASAARPAPLLGSGVEEAVSSYQATAAAAYLGMSYDQAAAAVVEKAREAVEALLLARLPAGPSPKGPGH